MQVFTVELMRDGEVVTESIESATLMEAFDAASAALKDGDTLRSVCIPSPSAALRASAVSKLVSGMPLTEEEARLVTGFLGTL
jgi:hypothetical protein